MCLFSVRNWLYTIIVHCICWSCSKHNLLLQHATLFCKLQWKSWGTQGSCPLEHICKQRCTTQTTSDTYGRHCVSMMWTMTELWTVTYERFPKLGVTHNRWVMFHNSEVVWWCLVSCCMFRTLQECHFVPGPPFMLNSQKVPWRTSHTRSTLQVQNRHAHIYKEREREIERERENLSPP